MITFTPPAENFGGVAAALATWVVLPQAIVIGLLVGILGRRGADALWAVPILLAYQLLVHAGFRDMMLGNPATLLVGLAPLPWALLILGVKHLRARRR